MNVVHGNHESQSNESENIAKELRQEAIHQSNNKSQHQKYFQQHMAEINPIFKTIKKLEIRKKAYHNGDTESTAKSGTEKRRIISAHLMPNNIQQIQFGNSIMTTTNRHYNRNFNNKNQFNNSKNMKFYFLGKTTKKQDNKISEKLLQKVDKIPIDYYTRKRLEIEKAFVVGGKGYKGFEFSSNQYEKGYNTFRQEKSSSFRKTIHFSSKERITKLHASFMKIRNKRYHNNSNNNNNKSNSKEHNNNNTSSFNTTYT